MQAQCHFNKDRLSNIFSRSKYDAVNKLITTQILCHHLLVLGTRAARYVGPTSNLFVSNQKIVPYFHDIWKIIENKSKNQHESQINDKWTEKIVKDV
jgi:hypothetical protein